MPPPATRRALLHTALGGLLIAGVFTVLNFRGADANRTARLNASTPGPSAGGQANIVFTNARSGNCLTWPRGSPNQPSFVGCKDDHLFEVVESVDMTYFQEPCQLAVQRYLGSHYDPNSKFTINVLWSGDAVGTKAERHLLCGLELPGPDSQPVAFRGQVAELDQSRVWPAGTQDNREWAPLKGRAGGRLPSNGPPSPVPPPTAVAAPAPIPTPSPPGPPAPATPTPSPTAASGPSAVPVSEAPPEPDAPAVIEIPGLAPITLPAFPPPQASPSGG